VLVTYEITYELEGADQPPLVAETISLLIARRGGEKQAG
jgi:hypothetical protein